MKVTLEAEWVGRKGGLEGCRLSFGPCLLAEPFSEGILAVVFKGHEGWWVHTADDWKYHGPFESVDEAKRATEQHFDVDAK